MKTQKLALEKTNALENSMNAQALMPVTSDYQPSHSILTGFSHF